MQSSTIPPNVVLPVSTGHIDRGRPDQDGSRARRYRLAISSSRWVIAWIRLTLDRTYPPAGAVPDRATLPQAWLDKLASATIPNIPVAQGTGQPTYPGRQTTDPEICSFTYECSATDDLQVPPAGVLAITFDDGPAGGSDALWKYLESRGDQGKVTHFMIGSYITRK